MRPVLLLAALAVPAVGSAAPITIDVTGTLSSYRQFLSGGSEELIGSLADRRISGSFTYDIDTAPAPVFVTTASVRAARFEAPNVAPLHDFVSSVLNWEGGAAIPSGPIPEGAAVRGDLLLSYNFDAPEDQLEIHDTVFWRVPGLDFQLQTSRLLLSGGVFYDDPLIMPTGRELPAAGFVGDGLFESLQFSAGGLVTGGYQLSYNVDSVSVRQATAVPEPGSLALMLAALGLLLRSETFLKLLSNARSRLV